ncbi:MAG: HNH endonuclease [Defluviitaleaceae bacterium]|nr:HNH endonuclease [Defluviitaleaceae bacterium]
MKTLNKYTFTAAGSELFTQEIINNQRNLLNDGTCNMDKVYLNQSISYVFDCFDKYHKNIYQLHTLTPELRLNKSHIDAWKLAYNKNPKAVKDLRKKYKEEVQMCPYCFISNISELDHYIPKARFPEYSLLNINLVPSCSGCNKIKEDKWSVTTPLFFNPFIHNFLEERFIKAELTPDNLSRNKIPSLKFYIDIDNCTNKSEGLLLQSHFDKLGLIKIKNGKGSYAEKATQILSCYLRILNKIFARKIIDSDESSALDYVESEVDLFIESSVETYSINSMEVALLYAIKESRDNWIDFFNHL